MSTLKSAWRPKSEIKGEGGSVTYFNGSSGELGEIRKAVLRELAPKPSEKEKGGKTRGGGEATLDLKAAMIIQRGGRLPVKLFLGVGDSKERWRSNALWGLAIYCSVEGISVKTGSTKRQTPIKIGSERVSPLLQSNFPARDRRGYAPLEIRTWGENPGRPFSTRLGGKRQDITARGE